MSQRRLAACLATSIAIVAVTLHGCGQGQEGAQKTVLDKANETAADTTNTSEVSTPAPGPAPKTPAPAPPAKETPAPTPAPETPAPAPPAEKDATTQAATEAPTTKAVTTTELRRKFETMEKGTCCCEEAKKVKDKDECMAAMAELKAIGTKEMQHEDKAVGWEGTEAGIPGACSIKVWPDGTWHGHWNKNKNGKKRDNMIPVCKKEADDDRLRLFDDAIQGDGPSSSSMAVGFVACLSMGVLMAGVGLLVMRRGFTSPVNRREVNGLIIGDDTEPEEA